MFFIAGTPKALRICFVGECFFYPLAVSLKSMFERWMDVFVRPLREHRSEERTHYVFGVQGFSIETTEGSFVGEYVGVWKNAKMMLPSVASGATEYTQNIVIGK